MKTIPEMFRAAGYHTSNADAAGKRPGKEDYNFVYQRADLYDGVDWSDRKSGQPFFSQFQLRGVDELFVWDPRTEPATDLHQNLVTVVTQSVHPRWHDRDAVLDAISGSPTLEQTLVIIEGLYPDRIIVLDSAWKSARDAIRFSKPRKAFELLISVSGVGPKLALSALSTLPIPNLCAAIESDDTETLASIPGVGKKSASRIILELKDKTNRIMISDAQKPSISSIEPTNFLQEEASSALINLGYRALEVKKAINLAISKIGETYELEDLIRTTLKELAKG